MTASAATAAAALREALDADGITQAHLAHRTGYSQKHISRVLTGQATAPLSTLDALASAVGRRWVIRLEDKP